ncbi:CACNA1E [Symbiodinium sp. CCMP2456]|nr:CACNA1E [Symbiodinium sp. CCMP2456]
MSERKQDHWSSTLADCQTHAVDKVVYIGHEQPIEVFRAKLPIGRKQWKLWILQRSALARWPKKIIIPTKIFMDEDEITEKIKNTDIPDDVDATYNVGGIHIVRDAYYAVRGWGAHLFFLEGRDGDATTSLQEKKGEQV